MTPASGKGGVVGDVYYRCPIDDTEWHARATLFPGNFDPAAQNRGDDCPTCGTECDQVVDWVPDGEFDAIEARVEELDS